MNGVEFAYFHFRVHRLKEGKCVNPHGVCVICELLWEGWPWRVDHQPSGNA